MISGLTVSQLYEYCMQQILLGNGDKYILVANDEDGSGYHPLYFQFTDDGEEINKILSDEYYNGCNADNSILLG